MQIFCLSAEANANDVQYAARSYVSMNEELQSSTTG